MPHAAGWTLGTFRIVFVANVSNDIMECVLQYDLTTLPATLANAQACVDAADTHLSAPVVGILGAGTTLLDYSMLLDDGVNQVASIKRINSVGTHDGFGLPQAVCAIWSKRADGRGRRRFGHLCWPGVTADMLATENDLNPAQLVAYDAVASALNTPTGIFELAGTHHILYHRDLDTKSNVVSFFSNRSLRNNRHRTPGRGV